MRVSELKLNDQLVVIKLAKKDRKALLVHKVSGDYYELYTDEIHEVNVEQLVNAAGAVLSIVRQYCEDFEREITVEQLKADAVQRVLAGINQLQTELECWPKGVRCGSPPDQP